MWLKSSVDRQDKIEFLNFRQTEKIEKVSGQNRTFFLVGQYRKLPSLSDRQTNIYYYVIYILSARSGGQEYY